MKSRDPLALSSVLSVFAAAAATGLVATGGVQRSALGVALLGLAGLGAGVRFARHGHRLVGGLLAVGGGGGLALSLVRARAGTPVQWAELYPALLGVTLLTLGLAPIRRGWERWLVSAGTATVLVAVVTSGVVQSATTMALLAAGVATVVAWDLGEQAVNLSDHVGSDARTWTVESTHGGASVAVGALAIGLALTVTNVDVTGVPLAGLGVLLGATVVLTAALYN
jgi:hypothetical protein